MTTPTPPTLAPLAPLGAGVGRWSALDVLGVCVIAYLAVVVVCRLPRAWRRLGSPRLNWRALSRGGGRG